MKKFFLYIFVLFAGCLNCFGQALLLTQDDIVVLKEDAVSVIQDSKGFHLYVKKHDDIKSIRLMVVSTNYNDPGLSTIRAKKTNRFIQKENYYYAGKTAKSVSKLLPESIIATKTENHPSFGECFHTYIPKEMYYGYVIQNQNEISFENGMAVNIRTYSKKGCDPTGKWQDNFLNLFVSDYKTEEAYSSIAQAGQGEVFHIVSKEELTQKLVEEVNDLDNSSQIDLVFAIDATASMKDDFAELKAHWLPVLQKQLALFSDLNAGLLLYKDYGSDYFYKGLPVKFLDLSKNYSMLISSIKNVSAGGGSDEEEAVYEALYACVNNFSWRKDSVKKLVLIGDAAPHSSAKNGFNVLPKEIFKQMKQNIINADVFLILESAAKAPENFKAVTKKAASDVLEKSVDQLNSEAK